MLKIFFGVWVSGSRSQKCFSFHIFRHGDVSYQPFRAYRNLQEPSGVLSELIGVLAELIGVLAELIRVLSKLIGVLSELLGVLSELNGVLSELIGAWSDQRYYHSLSHPLHLLNVMNPIILSVI